MKASFNIEFCGRGHYVLHRWSGMLCTRQHSSSSLSDRLCPIMKPVAMCFRRRVHVGRPDRLGYSFGVVAGFSPPMRAQRTPAGCYTEHSRLGPEW